MNKLINQVDHIMIQSKYAEDIFKVLFNELNIPASWDIKSYGGGVFTSGGISFGNVNIEIIRFAKLFRILGIAPKQDGIVGIAFEPGNTVEETCTMLDTMKINHGKAKPFNNKKEKLWTNIDMKNILNKSRIFFCKYYFKDVVEFRKKMTDRLKKNNGGLIGAEKIQEIVVKYKDDEVLEKWKKISQGNYKKEDNIIYFNDGPVIKMIKSDEECISAIYIKVKSVEQARNILKNNKSVTLNDNNEIILTNKKLNIGIKLVE